MIEAADCKSCEAVERELEKEVRGKTWEKDKKGFEQHMREEDDVRLGWKSVKFEKKLCISKRVVRKCSGEEAPML